MKYSKEDLVADVVSDNIKTADVFKKHSIDFCCGGGISIEKACAKKNIDAVILLQEINSIGMKGTATSNYNQWDLSFLCDYIVNTHHHYIKDSFILLDDYSAKVAKVHGEHYPIVIQIQELYAKVRNELSDHMIKEENVLFPYIKQIEQSQKENAKLNLGHFGSVQNPIKVMVSEHEIAGDIFREIAFLSHQYTPPEWACNTFKALYAKLEEFEQDLHIHVHLENNILFPKAIKIEKSLMNFNV